MYQPMEEQQQQLRFQRLATPPQPPAALLAPLPRSPAGHFPRHEALARLKVRHLPPSLQSQP